MREWWNGGDALACLGVNTVARCSFKVLKNPSGSSLLCFFLPHRLADQAEEAG